LQRDRASRTTFRTLCACAAWVTQPPLKTNPPPLTPERAVIATDSGQPFHAKPPDQFRLFAQTLHEFGVTEDAIKQMAIKNPAYLLGEKVDNR